MNGICGTKWLFMQFFEIKIIQLLNVGRKNSCTNALFSLISITATFCPLKRMIITEYYCFMIYPYYPYYLAINDIEIIKTFKGLGTNN